MNIPKVLAKERRHLFVKLIVIGLTQAALTILTALLIRFVFDHWITQTQNEFGEIAIFTVISLILVTIFSALMRYGERVNAERLGQHYTYTVRLALYDKLVSIAPQTLQKRSKGAHLLRFIGDLNAFRYWVSLGLVPLLVVSISSLVAVSAMAVFIDKVLAATVAFVLFTGVGVSLFIGRRMYSVVRESRNRRAIIASNVNEKISALPVVQVFNQVNRERNRLTKQNKKLKQAMIDRAKVIGLLRGITEATSGIAVICVLLVGAIQVSQNNSTPGVVVAAMSLLGMLLPSWRNLGRVHEYWNIYKVAVERIGVFMEIPEQITDLPDTKRLNVTKGKITFKNVTKDNLFTQLDGVIAGGSRVAIVGANGVGKSTMLNMISRLVEPDSGDIFIDDQNIKLCTLSSIRKEIGIVSHDLPLLRGSMGRNLKYRYKRPTELEFKRVCKLCGVDKILAKLPQGINTRIVDGGLNFSVGERQRIALARALLGNPKILLLDEVDANFDIDSKNLFDRIIDSYSGTVLMITHNKERAANADCIWSLDKEPMINPDLLDNTLGQNKVYKPFLNLNYAT